MALEESILDGTKKNLGVDPSSTVFDNEILTGINTALSTLSQLGIGPEGGFRVEDDEPQWTDFVPDDPRYEAVKTYVQLRTKLLFDPPQTSYVVTAMKEQIEELEWRLNDLREYDKDIAEEEAEADG